MAVVFRNVGSRLRPVRLVRRSMGSTGLFALAEQLAVWAAELAGRSRMVVECTAAAAVAGLSRRRRLWQRISKR